MDCLDRDVLLSEPFDDIFAHLGIEVREAQTCTATDQVTDLGVSIFDVLQQLKKDIVGEMVRVGCVVEFVSKRLEQGLLIACFEAQ